MSVTLHAGHHVSRLLSSGGLGSFPTRGAERPSGPFAERLYGVPCTESGLRRRVFASAQPGTAAPAPQ